MPTDEEKLLLRLEVTQRKFERQLANAAKSADRRSRQIERRFQRANKQVGRSFTTLSRGAVRAFAAVAAAVSTRELIRYADAWTEIQNQIAAAEQISGIAARSMDRINDIAQETRAGLRETANLYARLLRVSGALGKSEEDVARATEIVAKAFKAGGSAASEQAAGVLQLSQALGSGFLQGDELRSLRENAPLIAQAIADEFETTIGGLKDLGAEGELTADRVFSAILNAQQGIEAAFSRTVPTVSDGFTALQNGFMELVGAFSEGSQVAAGMAVDLQALGQWMSNNAEAVERFGARVREAGKILDEWRTGLRESISEAGLIDFEGMGDKFRLVVQTMADVIKVFVATMRGAAEAIGQAFVNMADSVWHGVETGMETVKAAIDEITAAIANDINIIISGLNALIDSANMVSSAFGASMQRLDPVEFSRLASGEGIPAPENRSVSDAFKDGFSDAVEAMDRVADRIERAGDKTGLGLGPTSRRGHREGEQFKATTETAKELEDAAGGLGRVGKAAKEANDQMRELESLTGLFKDALVDAAVSGEFGFEQLRNAIARAAAEYALFGEGPLSGLLGDFGGILGTVFDKLPGFATGTNFAPGGLAVVGERGPELVNLPRGSQVIPNHQLGGVMSGGLDIRISAAPGVSIDDVRSTARDVSVQIFREGINQYDRQVAPRSVRRINNDPRVVG